jgi:hypothetical protein
MTTAEWIAKARQQAPALLDLVANYHPRSDGFRSGGMPITAGAAEAACQIVRAEIAAQVADQPPTVALQDALRDGNVSAIMSALDEAWFGVPESTSCWRIRGFKEAVDLMEDPPDLEEAA